MDYIANYLEHWSIFITHTANLQIDARDTKYDVMRANVKGDRVSSRREISRHAICQTIFFHDKLLPWRELLRLVFILREYSQLNNGREGPSVTFFLLFDLSLEVIKFRQAFSGNI